MKAERFLTISEVARALETSPRTVRRLIRQRDLTMHQDVLDARKRLIAADDVLKLERNRIRKLAPAA
jgi:excisionase family DNA binding protein